MVNQIIRGRSLRAVRLNDSGYPIFGTEPLALDPTVGIIEVTVDYPAELIASTLHPIIHFTYPAGQGLDGPTLDYAIKTTFDLRSKGIDPQILINGKVVLIHGPAR